MHAAKLNRSERLQRVHRLLESGGEYSTMDIVQIAKVCAVNSLIAELRCNGINIPPARRQDGNYYYRLNPVTLKPKVSAPTALRTRLELMREVGL